MVTAHPEYGTDFKLLDSNLLLFGVLLSRTMTLDAEPCGDVGLGFRAIPPSSWCL